MKHIYLKVFFSLLLVSFLAIPLSASNGFKNTPQFGLIGNFCTGSIISKNLVLTSAHCLTTGKYEKATVNLNTLFEAFYPKINVNSLLTGEKAVGIKAIVLPKEYFFTQKSGTSPLNHISLDFALIELENDIELKSYNEIQIYKASESIEDFSIYSYGNYKEGLRPYFHQCASLNLMDLQILSESFISKPDFEALSFGPHLSLDCRPKARASGAPVFNNEKKQIAIYSSTVSNPLSNNDVWSLGTIIDAKLYKSIKLWEKSIQEMNSLKNTNKAIKWDHHSGKFLEKQIDAPYPGVYLKPRSKFRSFIY